MKEIETFIAESVTTSEINDTVTSLTLYLSDEKWLVVGEWHIGDGSDRKELYIMYGDEDTATGDCLKTIRLSRSEVNIELLKPLSKCPNISGFHVNLDIPDYEYNDLIRASNNIFSRYPGKFDIEA
jgi:hypothetical protein